MRRYDLATFEAAWFLSSSENRVSQRCRAGNMPGAWTDLPGPWGTKRRWRIDIDAFATELTTQRQRALLTELRAGRIEIDRPATASVQLRFGEGYRCLPAPSTTR